MSGYLTGVAVRPGLPLEGHTVRDALRLLQLGADILYLVHDADRFVAPLARKEVCATTGYRWLSTRCCSSAPIRFRSCSP
jgi:hypothetical protein